MAKKELYRVTRIGDLVEMDVVDGLCYMQIIHHHERDGQMCRVFPTLREEPLAEVESLVGSQEQFLAYTFAESFVGTGDGRVRGNFPVPGRLAVPPVCKACQDFRYTVGIRDVPSDRWWLIDEEKSWKVGVLPEEYYDAPLTSTMPDFYLTGQLRTGWHPRDEVEREHRFSGDGYLLEDDGNGNRYELRPEGKVLLIAAPTRDPNELGIFTNDAAADWLMSLQGQRGVAPLKRAIEAIPRHDQSFCGSEKAERALAASQLLTWKCGTAEPTDSLDLVEDYLKTLRRPSAELLERAEQAVRRIERCSELRDLWEDTEVFGRWRRQVTGIAAQLTAARGGGEPAASRGLSSKSARPTRSSRRSH